MPVPPAKPEEQPSRSGDYQRGLRHIQPGQNSLTGEVFRRGPDRGFRRPFQKLIVAALSENDFEALKALKANVQRICKSKKDPSVLRFLEIMSHLDEPMAKPREELAPIRPTFVLDPSVALTPGEPAEAPAAPAEPEMLELGGQLVETIDPEDV